MNQTTVYLAASVGGHLELLEALEDSMGERPRCWITTDGSRPRALAARGEDVRVLPALDRRNLSLKRLLGGVGLALRLRPRVVITSGAGVVAPFCLTARLLGAKLLFIETMARVHHGSVTGRLLAPAAHRMLVQWPELAAVYRKAVVCAPPLLADLPDVAEPAGQGTFVSVGSHPVPFARLLEAVGVALDAHVLPDPVLAQTGNGAVAARGVQTVATLDPVSFSAAVRDHRITICHGGAGVIATVLRSGKRPMVMARRERSSEHVDDHQVQLIEKLDGLGLVVGIDGAISAADVELCMEPRPAARAFEGLPDARVLTASWLSEVAP